MENLGPTIRQLRLAKGVSQKAVYGGVVSRSFATRFERGANDIGATKLFALLDNLGLGADELRYIHQHYQPSPLDQALLETARYYEQQNFPALVDWIHAHEDSPHAYDQLVVSYNRILVLAYDHPKIALTPAVRPIYDHLLAANQWTVQELKLVQIIIPLIATNTGLAALSPLTHKMETNCQTYQTPWGDPFGVLQNLAEYYGTLFQQYLNHHAYGQAKAFKTNFDQLDTAAMNWDGRLTRQVWLGIWELYFGTWTTGQTLLNEVLALESHYHPHLDNSLYAIVQVRTKLAHDYRQSQQS